MPFLHFVNCVLLTYSPFLVIDQCYEVLAWSSFWPVIVAYLAAQLIKMVASTLLLPSSLTDDVSTAFSPLQEIVGLAFGPSVSPSIVDLAMIIWLFRYNRSIRQDVDSPSHIVVAYGWGLADAVATKLLPLWVNARGVEFSWEWIQLSIDANIQLVRIFALVAIAAQFVVKRRVSVPVNNFPLYAAAASLLMLAPIGNSYLASVDTNAWIRLSVVGAVVLLLGVIVKHAVVQSIRKSK